MNEITYTYTIVEVNEGARAMTVEYQSEGRQTMLIGARLPYANENLQEVIAAFAPVAYWIEQETPVLVPEVGITGTNTFTPQVPNA